MKIWTKLGLLAIVGLSLTACGGNAQNKSTSSSSSEKTDAKTGASKTMTYAEPSSLKKSYDVIIVGSGGAGMTAAIEAKDAGMNPVILEKMPMAGGNTSKASAGLNASEPSVEKSQGVTDSNDKFYEETLKGGGGTNDKELLRYFVDHSAAAVDWLAQNDIVLDNLTTTGGMSVSRTHRPHDGSAVGAYLVKGLEENISKHLQKSRREVITGLLIDIIKNKKAQNNNLDFVEYINKEIKNRSIKANVRYYKDTKDKLLVEYYNIKYLVEIDKVCKN